MAIINLRNSYLEIRGGGAGEQIEVAIGEGNFTYDEKRVIEYMRNRGALDKTREGDEQPIDVSFQFQWDWIKSASGEAITPEEAIKGPDMTNGAAAAWTSTGAACEPYAVDLVLGHEGCGAVTDEIITLRQFRYESLPHDTKAGTISCSGKCNVAMAEIVRSAYTPLT